MPTPDQAARAATIASVRHSSELEGGRSSDAARAIQDLWIAGEIDTDELGRRTRALYNLPPQPGDSDYQADVELDQAEVEALVDHFLPEALVDLAVSIVRQDDPLDRLIAGLDPGDAVEVRRYKAFLTELGDRREDRDRTLALYRKHYPEEDNR
jgi:hypothetical protein